MALKSVIATALAATTGAWRLYGATPFLVGSTFGSAETRTSNIIKAVNRGIKFAKGTSSTKVLRVEWIERDIYTFDGSSWSGSRFTTSGVISGKSGLYLMDVGGVPTLLGVYNTGGSNVGIKSTDGINWTEVNLTATAGCNFWLAEGTFNGQFVFAFDGLQGHFIWDPNTDLCYTNNNANFASGPQDFCEFGGEYYKVAEHSSTPGYWLWWFNANDWTPILQLATPGNSSVANTFGTLSVDAPRPLLFDSGEGHLAAVYCNFTNATDYGYACAQLTVSGNSASQIDKSSIVFDASWLYTPGTTTPLLNFECLCEMESSPPTPTVHLYVTEGCVGNPILYYPWNGFGAKIGNVGLPTSSGGLASYSLSHAKDGGSDRIFFPQVFDIRVTSKTVGSGTIEYHFQACAPLGTEVKSMTPYFSVNGQTPVNKMTLASVGVVTGPSPAPTLHAGNQQVDGITCDGNTATPTTYKMVWNASTEASPGPITYGERVKRFLRLFG